MIETAHVSCKMDCTYCHVHIDDEADGGYARSVEAPANPDVAVVAVWACRPCIAALELPWLAVVNGTPRGGYRSSSEAVPGWVPPEADDGEWNEVPR